MLPSLLKPYRVTWHTEDGEHSNIEVVYGEDSEEAVLIAMGHIADRFPSGYNPTVNITQIVEVKR